MVVTVFVHAPHRVDAEVERIVGRLSLEPTVSAARWQAEVHLESESPALAIDTGRESPRRDAIVDRGVARSGIM